jgi:hypothetical protein
MIKTYNMTPPRIYAYDVGDVMTTNSDILGVSAGTQVKIRSYADKYSYTLEHFKGDFPEHFLSPKKPFIQPDLNEGDTVFFSLPYGVLSYRVRKTYLELQDGSYNGTIFDVLDIRNRHAYASKFYGYTVEDKDGDWPTFQETKYHGVSALVRDLQHQCWQLKRNINDLSTINLLATGHTAGDVLYYDNKNKQLTIAYIGPNADLNTYDYTTLLSYTNPINNLDPDRRNNLLVVESVHYVPLLNSLYYTLKGFTGYYHQDIFEKKSIEFVPTELPDDIELIELTDENLLPGTARMKKILFGK